MQKLSNDKSMDAKNAKAGFMPTDAKENYEFNSKSEIPDDMTIGYIDGNPKNWKFANLRLVPKGTKEIEDAKKAKEAQKELDKQEKAKEEKKAKEADAKKAKEVKDKK